MKKQTVISLGIIAAVVVLNLVNLARNEKPRNSREEIRSPAQDSAEWLRRYGERERYQQALPELPPEPEWAGIISKLREAGGNRDSSKKGRVFAEALAGDRKATELAIRKLLLSDQKQLISEYSRSECLRYLHAFSDDPAATRQWVETSLPKLHKDATTTHKPEEHEVFLADGRVDEGIGRIQGMADKESDDERKLQHLVKIAKIARLTGRGALHAEVMETAKKVALRMTSPSDFYLTGMVEELALAGDWSTIRKIGNQYRRSAGDPGFQAFCLVAAYHLDGPAAFLKEMRVCPEMGISTREDYARLLVDALFRQGMDIGEMTVRAYMAGGEKDKARVTLEYLLSLENGKDAYYRLAVEFFPDRAEAMFQALRSHDPYQERPLIWLGEMALGNNDLVKAQELIDQAIALDPSDGEQGKFTRMQVYDVLSRILRAKGDAGKADFFSEVMKAIRQGEEADDYLEVGLTQEAIRRYQEALGHFGDAYCLQSRLAKTLMKAGKEEEAMKHFEKAFELMPVSFGPVESHCFGCEQIFEGEKVREVAVKTFNRIIEATPENPRTFYLLGLVLEEMEMTGEAITAMKKALELDPRYYNCARRLLQLVNESPENAREAPDLNKKLAAMAPYADLQEIYQGRTDLRQAWLDAQTPPPCPIKLEPLPLPFDQDATKEPSRWTYYGPKILVLDGWSTEELLSDNAFLQWLDYF